LFLKKIIQSKIFTADLPTEKNFNCDEPSFAPLLPKIGRKETRRASVYSDLFLRKGKLISFDIRL